MLEYNISYSHFGDKRLNDRFIKIIEQLTTNIGGSIPACGVIWSQTKAIYRFLSNSCVSFTKILRLEQERLLHYFATTGSLDSAELEIVYHIQDTTTLNYSDQKGRFDLSCLNYIDHRGFFLHTSLLLNCYKVLLGILEQDIYSRSEQSLGSARGGGASVSKSLPVEAKESYRWVHHFETFQALVEAKPNCHGISISDAESDFYELFLAKRAKNVDLIVRLNHDHKIDDGTEKVLESLNKQAVAGSAWITALKTDRHTPRDVELEIRYKKITLPVPQRLRWSSSVPKTAKALYQKMAKEGQLTLYAVQAKEINAPVDVEPIEWTILTTMPIKDYWDALDAIQKYAVRWQIEIFHLALKEGCAIEKLQLEKATRLENAIALYSIIAVKVVKLRYLSENCPDEPMTITGFSNENYFTLCSFLAVNYGVQLPRPDNPTVQQFTKALVLIAGGKPKNIGIRQLWKGLTKADIIFKTAYAMKKE